jgi:DNA-directed RNA polymerase subunit RPC12/RpoP
VYVRLLPWIQNHPHVDPEMGEYACSNCGSYKKQKRGFDMLVGGKKKQVYQCMGCGHYFRGKLIKE